MNRVRSRLILGRSEPAIPPSTTGGATANIGSRLRVLDEYLDKRIGNFQFTMTEVRTIVRLTQQAGEPMGVKRMGRLFHVDSCPFYYSLLFVR